MEGKLKHDATPSISGTIYQFYIALEHCHQLITGQKLYIEKYGDISISNNKQIEVKNYSDTLTDLHENIWKTLENWLQDSFEPSKYIDLILLTTQDYSIESTLTEWNKKETVEKRQLLQDIASNYAKREKKDKVREAQVLNVLSEMNKVKLNSILGRFKILDSSLISEDVYNKIKDTQASHIPSGNRKDYINALLGFIIAPESITTNNWEISFEDFSLRKQALSEQYCTQTKIFPQIQKEILESELREKQEHLFVKKIDEINYSEVKTGAISDYIKTNHLLWNELKNYAVPKDVYSSYEKDLIGAYEPKYRKAKRGLTNEDDTDKKSKDFYDDITGAPTQAFANFNNTPQYFRNGMYHNLADDESQDIKWNLKDTGTND